MTSMGDDHGDSDASISPSISTLVSAPISDHSSQFDAASSQVTSPQASSKPIFDEVLDVESVGSCTGQVKWFNDKLGYGFITLCQKSENGQVDKGRDVFVHHSGVKPTNSNFHSLRKGEYTSFNLMHGNNGPQAVDVTGIGGGTLMCDVCPVRKTFHTVHNYAMYGYAQAQAQAYARSCMAHTHTHAHAHPRAHPHVTMRSHVSCDPQSVHAMNTNGQAFWRR